MLGERRLHRGAAHPAHRRGRLCGQYLPQPPVFGRAGVERKHQRPGHHVLLPLDGGAQRLEHLPLLCGGETPAEAFDLKDVLASRPRRDDVDAAVSPGTIDPYGTVHGPQEKRGDQILDVCRTKVWPGYGQHPYSIYRDHHEGAPRLQGAFGSAGRSSNRAQLSLGAFAARSADPSDPLVRWTSALAEHPGAPVGRLGPGARGPCGGGRGNGRVAARVPIGAARRRPGIVGGVSTVHFVGNDTAPPGDLSSFAPYRGSSRRVGPHLRTDTV
jgi:hypothetical protein